MNSQDRSSSHELFQTEGILLLTSTFCNSQLSMICPWVPRLVVSTAAVMFFAPFSLPSAEKLSMAPCKCVLSIFFPWGDIYIYISFTAFIPGRMSLCCAWPAFILVLEWHWHSIKELLASLWGTNICMATYEQHTEIFTVSWSSFCPMKSMLLPAWPSGRPGWRITISAWVSGPEDSEETYSISYFSVLTERHMLTCWDHLLT